MCATPEWADASALLGEWELEEREDSVDCKTLVMLHEDGTVTLGQTSGPLPIAERSCCTWAASAHVTDVSTEVSMDIALERRFPGPTANVMLDASEIPDEDTYVTRRILRGVVSDGVVPGTFALAGEIDVLRDEIVGDVNIYQTGPSSDECEANGRMADASELVGVGYFTMIKVPDAPGSELETQVDNAGTHHFVRREDVEDIQPVQPGRERRRVGALRSASARSALRAHSDPVVEGPHVGAPSHVVGECVDVNLARGSFVSPVDCQSGLLCAGAEWMEYGCLRVLMPWGGGVSSTHVLTVSHKRTRTRHTSSTADRFP